MRGLCSRSISISIISCQRETSGGSNDDHNLKDWNGTRNQTKIAFPSSFRNLILNGIVQDDLSKGSNLKKHD